VPKGPNLKTTGLQLCKWPVRPDRLHVKQFNRDWLIGTTEVRSDDKNVIARSTGQHTLYISIAASKPLTQPPAAIDTA
jgi:hypothetical protein